MALMSVQNLSVTNRLSSTSLEVYPEEVLGLIGPNGAGKSTLLNAIAGILPRTGLITLSDQNIDHISSIQRARRIALLPQFIDSVWALSVEDIVSMGRLPWGDFDQKIIQEAMHQANIESLASRHVDELSGGERARVWLARVLANQPEVLLADEPVANLDIHYQQAVMQCLHNYARAEHSVVIAIHDLSLAARYCDRLVLMNNAESVIVGTVEEVLDSQLLSSVFEVDVYVDLENDPPVVLAQ
ncbi:MAG: iron complex transport system ATP-binding protein [Gammaproteobacteria bacterium]|jgi:iron complex transport system ATP-binding protein